MRSVPNERMNDLLRMHSASLRKFPVYGFGFENEAYSALSLCTKLNQLELTNAPGFNDLHFQRLLRNAPALENMKLSYCSSITDTSFRTLRSLRRLRHLRLQRCESITSRALGGLGMISTLRHLEFGNIELDIGGLAR